MQLTRTADYGVRVLTHLATLPHGWRVNSRELAEATGASLAFTAKILQQLVTARLVVSRRGHDGGFTLARDPAEISLLEVVTALEGGLCLNQCLPGGAGCERAEWCGSHPVWAEAQEKLASVLRSASIASIAQATMHHRERMAKTPAAGAPSAPVTVTSNGHD